MTATEMQPMTTAEDRSPTLGTLFGALAKAQAKVEGAQKGKVNPAFRSKYADLASIWDACREPLATNNLCIVQQPLFEGAKVGLRTTLGHASGEWLAATVWTTPKDNGPQALGSCLTYLRRYALAAVVGVCPDDDDGESAQGRGADPKGPTAATNPAPPAAQPLVVKASEIRHDGRLLSEAQLKKLHATRREAGGKYCSDEGDDKSEWRMKVLCVYRDQKGERITSSKQLSSAQASHLIDRMTAYMAKTRANAERLPDLDAMPKPSNDNDIKSAIKSEGLTQDDVIEYVLAPYGCDSVDQLAPEDKPGALQLLMSIQQGKEKYIATLRGLGFPAEHIQ